MHQKALKYLLRHLLQVLSSSTCTCAPGRGLAQMTTNCTDESTCGDRSGPFCGSPSRTSPSRTCRTAPSPESADTGNMLLLRTYLLRGEMESGMRANACSPAFPIPSCARCVRDYAQITSTSHLGPPPKKLLLHCKPLIM